MGVLDQFSNLNLNPEQTQGLLAAAAQMLQQSGPSRMPTSFGQVLGGGLGAYQGAMTEAKHRKMQEEQAAQMKQLRSMQIRDSESDFANQEALRQRAQELNKFRSTLGGQAQQQQAPLQQPSMGEVPMPSSTPMQSTPGMMPPQPQQAPQGMGGGQSGMRQAIAAQRLAEAQKYRQAGFVQEADAMEKQALDMQPKIKNWERVLVGGKAMFAPYFEDGSNGQPVPLEVAEKLEKVNRGGTTDMTNPFTGAVVSSLKNSQSPESIANNAVTMRGQNMTDARAREFNATQSDLKADARVEKQKTADMTKASQVASFDTMLGTLDRLGKHPGLSGSVGLRGMIPTAPGTDAANFQAELDTFQSQAFIPMVAQLKGMGALSDAEGRKLTAAVGALNPKMGEKAFKESIERITGEMEAAKGRVAGVAQQAKPAPKSVLRGQIMDGYRFKGGDPSQQANWEKM